MIQIEQCDGQRLTQARAAIDFVGQDFVEVAPVVQPRERVAHDLQAHFFTQLQVGHRKRNRIADGFGESIQSFVLFA